MNAEMLDLLADERRRRAADRAALELADILALERRTEMRGRKLYYGDVYGKEFDAVEAVLYAKEAGVPLAELLREWYEELAAANPGFGWNDIDLVDFDYMAAQIEKDAARRMEVEE